VRAEKFEIATGARQQLEGNALRPDGVKMLPEHLVEKMPPGNSLRTSSRSMPEGNLVATALRAHEVAGAIVATHARASQFARGLLFFRKRSLMGVCAQMAASGRQPATALESSRPGADIRLLIANDHCTK
jgi:hypothetical protein